VTGTNSPIVRIREISGVPQTPEKTIKKCDLKFVEALIIFLGNGT
jgi:hypothetical protein